MSISTGTSFALLHRSLVIPRSVHLRKQMMMKTWSFFIDVLAVHHVSEPYSITYFTFDLKILIFVLATAIDVLENVEHSSGLAGVNYFDRCSSQTDGVLAVFTSRSLVLPPWVFRPVGLSWSLALLSYPASVPVDVRAVPDHLQIQVVQLAPYCLLGTISFAIGCLPDDPIDCDLKQEMGKGKGTPVFTPKGLIN